VGYWLLTGKTLFDTKDVDALLTQQAIEAPPELSERSDRRLSADLEQLIMQCLAQRREQRPPSAEALEHSLAACASASAWTPAQAQAWWDTHLAGLETAPVVAMEEKTLVIAPRS
jgi:serine/threonine protein kinase